MSTVPSPVYIDAHAHVQVSQFDGDRAAMLVRAATAGVAAIICASDDEPTSRAAVDLAEQTSAVWATVGIHPHEAAEAAADCIANLASLATSPRVVAIGEIGLDYYRDLSPRPVQQRLFAQQLELAEQLDLPVVIHSRDAAADTYSMLRTWRSTAPKQGWHAPGIMHCFGYDATWAGRFLELNFLISIPGTVTYPKAALIQEVATVVPETMLTVETDSPYLAPQSRRGRRNEPAYLPETVSKIAALRRVDAVQLRHATVTNAQRLFRLDQPAGEAAGLKGTP